MTHRENKQFINVKKQCKFFNLNIRMQTKFKLALSSSCHGGVWKSNRGFEFESICFLLYLIRALGYPFPVLFFYLSGTEPSRDISKTMFRSSLIFKLRRIIENIL